MPDYSHFNYTVLQYQGLHILKLVLVVNPFHPLEIVCSILVWSSLGVIFTLILLPPLVQDPAALDLLKEAELGDHWDESPIAAAV